jgi:ribosomal protein S4
MAQNTNVYKPRYKVAFQAKSKIWPYKNSRLRRFFNIRGRKLIRRGLFKRYVLVFNNMKWTIARRYIKPYMKRRVAVRRRFKDVFYTKQQLRAFYGKIKENSFRNFFKKYLTNVSKRNNSFFSALERRTDVVMFRMRLLPTIFAANQFIHHQGVYINDKLEKSPNALVNPGDIVTVGKDQWSPIFFYLYERVYNRVYGKHILQKRQYKLLKKKTWWILRSNFFKKNNLELVNKIWNLPKTLHMLNQNFNVLHTKIIAESSSLISKESNLDFIIELKNKISRFEALKVSLQKFLIIFSKRFDKFKKEKRFLKWWRWKGYYAKLFGWVSFIYSQYKLIHYFSLRIKLEELNFYKAVFLHSSKEEQKKDWIKLITEREKLLIEKHELSIKKLEEHYKFCIRRRIKKESIAPKYRFDYLTKQRVAKGSNLLYFMINRKFKKERRLLTPRLKAVHWYLPNYIHFDFRTMRGVFLYAPLPNEIYFSFNCSLSKIHAFYRSIGL